MTGQHLDTQLLSPTDEIEIGSYRATLKARGLYSTFQFVLRLSPKIHRTLQDLPAGIVSASDLTLEGAQAASTYLHETVHWWQHIGSTYGFALSLGFPCGMQNNYTRLKQLIVADGFRKSIRSAAYFADHPSTPGTVAGLANIIINNQFDFSAFGRLTHSAAQRKAVLEDPMFESMGRAFSIAWSNVVGLIGSSFDPDWTLLTDPNVWVPAFDFLESKEAGEDFEGYLFRRSDRVPVYGIGAFEIMEGQARFAQLQFLHFGSGGAQDWPEFEAVGMLDGPYIAAFDWFLTTTDLVRPASFDDPAVALFMLICDMALNPGAGFPMPLAFPHTLVADLDPAARFDLLCHVVRLKYPEAVSHIRTYSREEYAAVSARLAAEAMLDAPLEIAETIATWPERSVGVKEVMAEYAAYDFNPSNLSIRVLFSHFVAFMQDKALRPQTFCWPGYWLTGERVSEDLVEQFDRQGALFIDKPDDDGIFPRLRQDRHPTAIQETFEAFYGAIVLYDMVQQWITEDGPFRYDYRWLVQHGRPEDFKTYADGHFVRAFEVHPDSVDLMPSWRGAARS